MRSDLPCLKLSLGPTIGRHNPRTCGEGAARNGQGRWVKMNENVSSPARSGRVDRRWAVAPPQSSASACCCTFHVCDPPLLYDTLRPTHSRSLTQLSPPRPLDRCPAEFNLHPHLAPFRPSCHGMVRREHDRRRRARSSFPSSWSPSYYSRISTNHCWSRERSRTLLPRLPPRRRKTSFVSGGLPRVLGDRRPNAPPSSLPRLQQVHT